MGTDAIFRLQRGITLVELVVVMALLGLLAGISFPTLSSGLDALRLGAASNSLVSFFNAALNRAERRQQVVEITISKPDRTLFLRSAEPGFARSLELPSGVTIRAVLPALPQGEEQPVRHFLLYPGGALPRFGLEISSPKGGRRIVRVDPITGVPQIERLDTP
jgi:prepilin-type N-terminal cleavage/methylation domain-containing protein